PLVPTPELLAEVVKGLGAEAVTQGMSYRALKVEVVKVAGVTSGRIVGEMTRPDRVTRLVQYSIPGDLSNATLTYTTTPENFAHYEASFEASAQATSGAVEARTRWQEITHGAGRDAIVGAVAGGIVTLLGALLKRRRRAAAAPAPLPPGSGPG